jgi:hypothetical protein
VGACCEIRISGRSAHLGHSLGRGSTRLSLHAVRYRRRAVSVSAATASTGDRRLRHAAKSAGTVRPASKRMS